MITVIFSSFNGERTIGVTLEAFCQLDKPAGGWKLIAADNGSTDNTASIMRSFLGRLPLKMLTVTARGKNNALNAALELVEGDLIVLTDDDVAPAPRWLCQLEECARLHPEHDLFGGAIVPRWPRPPEPWILSSVPLGMVYAVTDPCLKSGEIDHSLVWGPNMALRKRVFDKGVRFNGTVGPDGTEQYVMGSEGEFTGRLKQLGIKAWFCADARVEHLIRDHQLSRSWVLKRFFRSGRAEYLIDCGPENSRHLIFGADRWLYRKLAVNLLKTMGFLLIGNTDKALTALSQFYLARGSLFQARLMHRESASDRN